jgi:hypothetical protein
MFRDLKNTINRALSVVPNNSVAATVTGTGIDLKDQEAPVACVCCCGTASGTPSTQSVVWTVEESDSSGSGYSAISGATVTQTADSDIDVIQVNQRTKRYVRLVAVITFSGGSSPAIEVAGIIETQKTKF